ncbi:hypothetical protein BB560_005473, partial [Smittium megazygosporum]
DCPPPTQDFASRPIAPASIDSTPATHTAAPVPQSSALNSQNFRFLRPIEEEAEVSDTEIFEHPSPRRHTKRQASSQLNSDNFVTQESLDGKLNEFFMNMKSLFFQTKQFASTDKMPQASLNNQHQVESFNSVNFVSTPSAGTPLQADAETFLQAEPENFTNVSHEIPLFSKSPPAATILDLPTQTDIQLFKLVDENKQLKEQILLLNEKVQLLTKSNASRPLPDITPLPSDSISSMDSKPTTTTTPKKRPRAPSEPIKKPTFAEIAKKVATDKSQENVLKIDEALRNLSGAKSIFSGTKSEYKHGYSRLYVQGIARQEYSKVKVILKSLKFQLNKIVNLEFIGRKTLEFTVVSDYAPSFLRKIKELEIFSIIPKVDPSIPMDPLATEKSKINIKLAYQNRLKRTYSATNKKNFANYIFDLAAEAGIDLGTKRTFELPEQTKNPEPSSDNNQPEKTVPSIQDDILEPIAKDRQLNSNQSTNENEIVMSDED